MAEETKVRLSKDLADVIDKYKESLSREDFIDLCVKTFLKDQGFVVPETVSEPKPTKESEKKAETPKPKEAREAKAPVSGGREKPAAPAIAVQQGPTLQQEVRRPTPRGAVPAPMEESRGFPGEKYVNDSMFILLWLAAVGLYGLGDLVTTHWALQLGLVEANPIAALFGNILNMALFKVATIVAAFLISYTVFTTKGLIYSAPLMMLIAGAVLTINNVLKIVQVI